MKAASTIYLKFILFVLGALVLAICLFILPDGLRHTTNWLGYRPLLLAMYLPAIPFYLGLYHGYNLLVSIDTNRIFTESAVRSLGIIKYCGLAIGTMYFIGLPYILYVARMDDAPGVVLIGLIFAFAPLAIAIMASVVRQQLQHTIDLKQENDLTV